MLPIVVAIRFAALAVHVPGMFVEFKLDPQPPPMSVLRDSLVVHAMRDESKTFVDLRYVLENGDTPGPSEADAIFRMFEGDRAPPRPLSDEEQYELRRKRQVSAFTGTSNPIPYNDLSFALSNIHGVRLLIASHYILHYFLYCLYFCDF